MFRSIHKNYAIIISTIISIMLSGNVGLVPVFALTYSRDIGVNFTFNSSIQVTLSSDLVISNLAPGTAADSNVIDVNILTNNITGYTLNATVGNNTTYNTRNLVHSDSNATATFASVNYTATPTIVSNTDLADDTWAYSYSVDDGSTWSNYNGLPLYSDETNVALLKESNGPVATNAGDKVKFKIAARAASTQMSGEYNNVINFTAVAAPAPKTLEMAYADAGKTKLNGYYKMQDMSSAICADAEVVDEGSQMQVIDTRDNKVYWVTKLQDGKCWMTQNLDLDLDSTKTYTHADTDLGWGDTIDDTASWTPSQSTRNKDSGDSGSSSTVTPDPDPIMPGGIIGPDPSTPQTNEGYSFDPGDWYYAGYNGRTLLPYALIDYLTHEYSSVNSNTILVYGDANYTNVYFSNVPFSNNGTHGHVGNYYYRTTALAVDSTSGITANQHNSICPAGWRIPVSSTYSVDSVGDNEFWGLVYYYNNKSTGSNVGLEGAPLYFVRAGMIAHNSPSAGGDGYYFANPITESDGDNSYISFNSDYVSPYNNTGHLIADGITLRCVAR